MEFTRRDGTGGQVLHENGFWVWPQTKHLRWMLLPVSAASLQLVSRRSLGLPGGFWFAFDFNADLARKNPLAVIAAFQRAHPMGDGSVRLAFKTINGRADNDAWRHFVTVCAADPRITLLEGH